MNQDSITAALVIDTLPVISVAWKLTLSEKDKKSEELRLQKWLQTRLKMKYIEVRPMHTIDASKIN